MKIKGQNLSFKKAAIFVVPVLSIFSAANPLAAQNLPGFQDLSGNQPPQQFQQNQQDMQPSPALNIAPVPTRPPIPPPPEPPQGAQTIVLQSKAPASVSQAWRIKALQLFKSNNTLDKNSLAAMHLQAGYASAFAAIARALADAGVHLEAMSFSSGHMLISLPNDRGQSDKAIIAVRQAVSDNDGSPAAGTDVRLFCDSRNHALTMAQVQSILASVDAAVDNSKNKPGAESL